jgi:hypothetical protein
VVDVRAGRPADDPAREEVENDRKVKPASWVQRKVMSVTQAWLGPVAVKSRSRTFGAMGKACLESVVVCATMRLNRLSAPPPVN